MKATDLRRVKLTLLTASLVSVVLLLLSAYEENLRGEWRRHQQNYRDALEAGAAGDAMRDAAQSMEIKFRQIFLPKLDRVDRCTTCHIGIDDPGMSGAEQPLATHSGKILTKHPVDKVGCTVCHDGQGRVVERNAAHGEVEHWSRPLLRGDRVYTSCSRCHYENDLFGWEMDRFAPGDSARQIDQDQLAASLPTIDGERESPIARGKRLVLELGCLSCHKYRGRGGTLGPDITFVGDKTVHDFDFTNVKGEYTVRQWLFEHFEDPALVTPASQMRKPDVSPEQARDLTLYMLSLQKKIVPVDYTPVPQRGEGSAADGKQLYTMFCSGCHGADGRGIADPVPELKTPSLSNPDTLAVASDEYLRSIIEHGRSGTKMVAWGDPRGGGLHPDELDRIVHYIRSWQPHAPTRREIRMAKGDVERGGESYARNCAACHGEDGEGGIGTALNSVSFLAIASDDFLSQSIAEGRPNTAMPNWRVFDARQIADLIAVLRSRHPLENDRESVLTLLDQRHESKLSTGDSGESGPDTMMLVERGAKLFRKQCATCHGPLGEGGLGPLLNSQELLALWDEEYLYSAIVDGRPGTSMPTYRHLKDESVAALIAFLKSWQTVSDRALTDDEVQQGNWRLGKVLYERLCMECHGQAGEGGSSTQLANRVFAASAGDALLRDLIQHGLTPSPTIEIAHDGHTMPPFGGSTDADFPYSLEHVNDIVAYVRELQRAATERVVARRVVGDVVAGEKIYLDKCAKCHAESGEGAIGASLSNAEFLAAANDDFLIASVVLGRENTEMLPSGPHREGDAVLNEQELLDMTAYVRSWETEPPRKGVPQRFLVISYEDDPMVEMSVENGHDLFAQNCAACHGPEGRGTRDPQAIADCASCHADGQPNFERNATPRQLFSHFGPQLNTPEFLTAATDGFLQATIVRGRRETPMRGFGRPAHGREALDADSINDIVIYIRSWDMALRKSGDDLDDASKRN